MESTTVISCNTCVHSMPVMYKNKMRRVCGLANKVTVRCLTGSRESYSPMSEEQNETHN